MLQQWVYYTITELGTEGESESLIVLRTAGAVGRAMIKAMKNERLISLFKVPKNSYLSSGVAGFCAQAFCADWDNLWLLNIKGFITDNLVILHNMYHIYISIVKFVICRDIYLSFPCLFQDN